MKKFNKVISIEVSVDNIANQLLATWAGSSFPHAEMLAETIIGTALNNSTVNLIYNNLNGYTNNIDFKPGDMVISSEQVYAYVQREDGEYTQKYVPIGECVIIRIDEYRTSDKVQIQYNGSDSKGNLKSYEKWVSHLSLELRTETVEA